MNWKSLTALVILLAAAGGFYVYDTYKREPAREKAESAKGRLWDVEAKDVETVTIKRKADTIRLKRAEGGWEMLEPVRARGDRAPIDQLVTSLATLRVDREIDPNPSRPADFGLDPVRAEVKLEAKGRSEPLAVSIGGKNPTGAWVYARQGGKPAVFTLSEFIGRDVERPASEFRDKTVLAFDRKSVAAIDLAIEGQKISLEAGDGQTWRIVKPGPYRADAELIRDFLDKLQSAKAKEFVADGPKSLQPWGLDRPTTVTLWTGKDKERASKVLLFGRTDKDRKGVYVMRAGDTSVMLGPEDLWTAVPKTAAALRDKVVVASAADTVNRLEVEHARGKVTVEKAGGEWKITAPEALKADSGAVANLLWKVRDLRASGFLGETAADIPRYLAKPEVTVRLWQEGAKEPMVLLLRSSPESRKGQPQAVAAVQGQGPVVLVDGKAIGDLSKTVTDLRDHSIFPAFETKDVKRLVVTAGGKRMVVERSGETDWKVLEPLKGVAKEHKVVNALLTLKALRWKDMLASRGDEAARFGFDTPEVEVTVLKSDGGELATLQVGRQDGGLTYVRLKSPPTVYSVETKTLGDLRKAQTDIPG